MVVLSRARGYRFQMLEASLSRGILTIQDPPNGRLLESHGEARLGDGRLLTTIEPRSGLRWKVQPTEDGILVWLILRNETGAAVRVEQLRPLVASDGYRGLPLEQLRIQSTGWQSWSRAHPPAPFEPNATLAAPPIRGPHLPHRHPDGQTEAWMTILDGSPSLLLGFVSATRQLGTVEIAPTTGGRHSLTAATELEGTPLAADTEVESEPLLLAVGDTGELTDRYARAVAAAMRSLSPWERAGGEGHAEPLTGWCSWYELYTAVSEGDVRRNLHVLRSLHDRLPLRLVQLDDGYQHAVGDWLELNDKFPSGMPALVKEIQKEGFEAGIWLAPFLLSARSHTFKAHPDWVVRDEQGAPLNAIDNWGSPNYALDTTHPTALEWLRRVLRTIGDEWGFQYLKLDFLYAASLRGRRFQAGVTSVEAYRRGLATLREAAGDRFILGCGAPLVLSVGLVDGMRIGSDVASFWGDEGNSDGPSMRNALRATLARMWMHGRWWTNDPDCLLVRADDSQLTLDEVRAWATVVALTGGMLLVGDDLSRVSEERLELLARLVPPSGLAARALPPLVNSMPEQLHLCVVRDSGVVHLLGIANWSATSAARELDPSEFGLDPSARYHVVDQWSGAYLGRLTGRVDLGVLPPHSVRLLSVREPLDRPQVVGSTAHLLGDAIDVSREEWNPGSGILSVVPRGDARPGEILVVDSQMRLRRLQFSPGVTVTLEE
jgi:alpha-galactosidase